MKEKRTLLAALLCVAAFGLWLGQPAEAAQDIVYNGNFEGGFYYDAGDNIPNGWTKNETVSGSNDPSQIQPVSDNGPTLPGSTSLYWQRIDNGSMTGDWTVVQQYLGYDISACSYATLSIDIKVLYHNLGGSGWTPTEFEFPATVVIYYLDASGTLRYWQWGWWQWIDGATGPNPDHKAVPGNGVVTGQQVPYNVWVPNTFNLLTELTNPRIIRSIWVGGSGWSFEGQADNVQLVVCDAAQPRDLVVCEPQGGNNPTHPNTYWYDVTPAGYGRCDFHVKVFDTDPSHYSGWVEPPTWQHALHKVGSDWWVSWWDPDCSDAIFSKFRFQFNNPCPSTVSDWTTTIGASSDPFFWLVDRSSNHFGEADGYGYRVHVPYVGTPPCCNDDGIRGDVDYSGGSPNVADLTYLVDYLFFGGLPPPCEEEGDVEGSGAINVADVTYLVAYLFMAGQPPSPCGGDSLKADVAQRPHSGISLKATHESGTTVISLESSMDLRGVQIELVGRQTGVPVKLVEDDLELFFRQNGQAARIGIFDLQGSTVIPAGSRLLVRVPGEFEITDALVSDLEHNALIPTILPAAKRSNLPAEFSLGQNYPNPFNPITEISFGLPDAADVKLDIYNLMGQKVATLIDDRREAGHHVVQWDGSQVASGIYLYRLKAGSFTETKKMLLLK